MIPIMVVAHQDRCVMAEKLAAQVGALIWWDDGSHPGDHKAGCANTHIGALASVCGSRYADDAGWVCILEDDAVPVIGFREHLDAALSAASGFFSCHRSRQALEFLHTKMAGHSNGCTNCREIPLAPHIQQVRRSSDIPMSLLRAAPYQTVA